MSKNVLAISVIIIIGALLFFAINFGLEAAGLVAIAVVVGLIRCPYPPLR